MSLDQYKSEKSQASGFSYPEGRCGPGYWIKRAEGEEGDGNHERD